MEYQYSRHASHEGQAICPASGHAVAAGDMVSRQGIWSTKCQVRRRATCPNRPAPTVESVINSSARSPASDPPLPGRPSNGG
jgi:hypothetical protein